MVKSILVTLVVISSFLMQGFSSMACDHSEKPQEQESHCHSQKTEVHQSHQHRSSQDQLETTEADTCLMCQTGACSLEKASLLVSLQDGFQSASKVLIPLFIPAQGWMKIASLVESHSLRGPPIQILLPQFKNWQAFFSIFRN